MLCRVQGLSRICQWQLRGWLRTAIACCLCCSAHPFRLSCHHFFCALHASSLQYPAFLPSILQPHNFCNLLSWGWTLWSGVWCPGYEKAVHLDEVSAWGVGREEEVWGARNGRPSSEEAPEEEQRRTRGAGRPHEWQGWQGRHGPEPPGWAQSGPLLGRCEPSCVRLSSSHLHPSCLVCTRLQ